MGVIEKAPVYLEKVPGGSIAVTTLDWAFNSAKSSSMWYVLFGLACCAIEGLMAAGSPRFDLDRFGIFHRGSPRQCDLMIVAGTVTLKMAERVKTLYHQMPEPKYVIAMGGCAINGGPFYYDSYSVLKGVDKVIPVDVYVPGCPPRPEALYYGIIKLREKIMHESIKKAPEEKSEPLRDKAEA
ncbi:MAG: NADH-quinone oxidoreductase subunit B [Chloroflexi bacterium]|nr:NADH-quinone oxidoreductase subunit B [Chloroflexota bacterium]